MALRTTAPETQQAPRRQTIEESEIERIASK
jgi:hypothetical protein